MSQRGYTIAFAAVLVAVCLGAFFGGRYLYHAIVGDSAGAAAWTPPETRVAAENQPTVDAAQAAMPAQGTDSAQPAQAPSPRPLPTVRAILTPFVPPTPTLEPTETEAPLMPTLPSVQEPITATATITPEGNFEFVLAGPLRATNGDCSGNLILGRVVDRNGVPMAGVRLHLTDEYGVENTVKTTKAEKVDLGRYDFPLSGPGRRYFLVVENSTGQPVSERIEIPHNVGPAPKASCHWADWRQR